MSSVNNVNSGVQHYQLSATDRFGTGARVGNIRLADFRKSTEMYTKTEPTRSDEEIKEDIARIAREDQKKEISIAEPKDIGT